MQRFPIFYPEGAGFDGAPLRALHAAIVNASRILIGAAIALTVSSRSLNWILDLRLWALFAALVTVYWCVAMLYEWRCGRRRKKRGPGYRLELQKMVLERRKQG